VILFLHNRYRTTGGEERAVEDLRWLVAEHLGQEVKLLERDSARLGRARAAAGLLSGGLAPADVAGAVRLTGAKVVHAHNLNPTLGWRALAAARDAGARVVLHLHNYRLICAVGTCFTRGADCTRCHARNTLPGVRLNCRGTGAEAAVYGASLSLWQRRMVSLADAVIVPSRFARQRLTDLGAPLPADRVYVVPHPVRSLAVRSRADRGVHALVSGRLAPEKGVDVAIEACQSIGLPLVVAGDGPLRSELERRGADADVRFAGSLDPTALAEVRGQAALALVPSRSAETFGLSAAEAMADGVPVVASRIGALPELVDPDGLVAPGDPAALAEAARRRWRSVSHGEAGIAAARAVVAPEVVAPALGAVYEAVGA